MIKELESKRLRLRGWKDSDTEPFIAMNADEQVMRFFPAPLTPEQTCASIERIKKHFDANGFGLFAVETKEDDKFIGFVGLQIPPFEASFTPCVEVGWRLAKEYWGRGYAPEAAQRVLAFGFEECQLAEIISMTATVNKPSIRVMEKIGMHRSDDFMHPKIADGHILKPHVLYRIKAGEILG